MNLYQRVQSITRAIESVFGDFPQTFKKLDFFFKSHIHHKHHSMMVANKQ